jgi:hypothetical protein
MVLEPSHIFLKKKNTEGNDGFAVCRPCLINSFCIIATTHLEIESKCFFFCVFAPQVRLNVGSGLDRNATLGDATGRRARIPPVWRLKVRPLSFHARTAALPPAF